ncbi:MAG: ArsA family ATPase [Chloroflexi bacterium]|nr:ArsA family ATPase [Chloroflexota bacterium]
MDRMDSKNVIMLCGKGGVGKTTCAAATALHYAATGHKTLVISSDLTPSLLDIFEINGGQKPAKASDNLYVDEISYESIKALWDKKFGPEVYDVFSSLVDISYEDFVDFITSILPGLRDEFMVDYIRELSESGQFEKIVWDTAPAGQTLGLLRMPSMLNEHLKAAPRIYSSLIATGQKKRSVLGVIKEWQELSNSDMEFLKKEVELNLVTIAEALAVRQIDDIVAELQDYGLHISHLIINQVVEEPDSPFLQSRARMQRTYIAELQRKYNSNFTILPLFPGEIKGTERLREVARRLFGNSAGLHQ